NRRLRHYDHIYRLFSGQLLTTKHDG
ncbi:hypothetical protein VCHENC02_5670B, partial [Vibrio harveyi]